ncbi:hypothetical protein QVD17_01422 [Tagetes erecta]|uniref:Uncharacterized protein n=1 Tax=Tagetes erecta TaxID=13708 RepID=A0AAD8LAL9_TARER|nr:hypothetical protein QVD17_01422 [Tagetes erecta]
MGEVSISVLTPLGASVISINAPTAGGRSGRGEEERGGGFDACGRVMLLAEELVDVVIVRGEVKGKRGWQRGPFLFGRACGEDDARVVLAYHSVPLTTNGAGTCGLGGD